MPSPCKAGKIFSSMNLLHAWTEMDVSPSTLKLQTMPFSAFCRRFLTSIKQAITNCHCQPSAICNQVFGQVYRAQQQSERADGLPVKVSIQRKDRLQVLLDLQIGGHRAECAYCQGNPQLQQCNPLILCRCENLLYQAKRCGKYLLPCQHS